MGKSPDRVPKTPGAMFFVVQFATKNVLLISNGYVMKIGT